MDYNTVFQKYPKVLVVDDEKEHLKILSNFLKNEKFSYTAANSKEDAETLIKEQNFDWALLDIDLHMHKFGGIELAEQIYNTKVPIPIMYITGRGDAYFERHRLKTPYAIWENKIAPDEIIRSAHFKRTIFEFLQNVEDTRYNIYLNPEKTKFITVVNGGSREIRLENIVYITIENKNKYVYTDLQNEPYMLFANRNMDDFPYPLRQCNKQSVVNVTKIVERPKNRKRWGSASRESFLKLKGTKKEIQLSRDRIQEFQGYYDAKPE